MTISVPPPSPDETPPPEETSWSSSSDGMMQVAAALAFHLPGARLDMSSADGARCSIGPLTDPRCSLHPAEFREMVVSKGGAFDPFTPQRKSSLGAHPTLSLTSVMSGVRHVGSGLYRIAGLELTSYAFVTLLPASRVDVVLSTMQAEVPVEYDNGQPVEVPVGEETIAVNLVQDEGLGVTLVVMCSTDTSDTVAEQIARSAVSACLVSEMEYVIQDCR